jgi:hypothetical protein
MSVFTVTVHYLSGGSVSTPVRYTSDEFDTRSVKDVVIEKAIEKLFGARAWFFEDYSNPSYGQIFRSLVGRNCSTSVTNGVRVTVAVA